ncbi:MAG: hypothetical protein Q8922_11125 [Bacteroidota bacterium]|nr:hypothetical protein [Bacteroidota bacterium]MDP4288478.1 hypothetical protein [Bacteroidota bacterium]
MFAGVRSRMSLRSLFSICIYAVMLITVSSLRAQIPDDDRQAPPLSPQEYAQKLRLAEVYEETHDVQNAARVYEELYHTNPSDQIVFEGLTRCLVYLKKFDEAEKIVSYRLAKDGSSDVLLLWARLEARLNKRTEALDAFHKAEEAMHATDCSQLFPIVYAMMDVSYNQEAMQVLDRMRKLATNDAEVCSSQIAGLYLRLGDFDRAATEFVGILKGGEANLGMVEQRLAEYTTDSMSRTAVLGSLERAIHAASSDGEPAVANLRLLSWLYQEKKDYAKALQTMTQLDGLAANAGSDHTMQGFELLQFADRVRNEGALDVAVKAYREALKRLESSSSARNNYFIQQAQLGSLKTEDAYYSMLGSPKDSMRTLIIGYEDFAAKPAAGGMTELALDALTHAGQIAFHVLFDLDRATKDYESAITLSHGVSEPMQRAAFGLVDIAFAKQEFPLAERRLQTIEHALAQRATPSDKEVRNHILYDRALSNYYQDNFDTSLAQAQSVANDAGSDFANDAIQLSGLIEENVNPANRPALAAYAKAALAEVSRRYDTAQLGYASVAQLFPSSPLADDATIRSAEVLVKLGKAQEAVGVLDTMQETMLKSPLLDVAAFRAAEITEKDLHDKAHAQKRYEDFLARYPSSTFTETARERARKLRGDAF